MLEVSGATVKRGNRNNLNISYDTLLVIDRY